MFDFEQVLGPFVLGGGELLNDSELALGIGAAAEGLVNVREQVVRFAILGVGLNGLFEQRGGGRILRLLPAKLSVQILSGGIAGPETERAAEQEFGFFQLSGGGLSSDGEGSAESERGLKGVGIAGELGAPGFDGIGGVTLPPSDESPVVLQAGKLRVGGLGLIEEFGGLVDAIVEQIELSDDELDFRGGGAGEQGFEQRAGLIRFSGAQISGGEAELNAGVGGRHEGLVILDGLSVTLEFEEGDGFQLAGLTMGGILGEKESELALRVVELAGFEISETEIEANGRQVGRNAKRLLIGSDGVGVSLLPGEQRAQVGQHFGASAVLFQVGAIGGFGRGELPSLMELLGAIEIGVAILRESEQQDQDGAGVHFFQDKRFESKIRMLSPVEIS